MIRDTGQLADIAFIRTELGYAARRPNIDADGAQRRPGAGAGSKPIIRQVEIEELGAMIGFDADAANSGAETTWAGHRPPRFIVGSRRSSSGS
jgi:hypothetical protein